MPFPGQISRFGLAGFSIPWPSAQAAVLEASGTIAISSTGVLSTSILMTASGTVGVVSSGALTTSILMVGSSVVSITSLGELIGGALLSGASQIAVGATGALSTSIVLTGQSVISVSSAGAISTQIVLVGQSVLSIVSAGDLFTSVLVTPFIPGARGVCYHVGPVGECTTGPNQIVRFIVSASGVSLVTDQNMLENGEDLFLEDGEAWLLS